MEKVIEDYDGKLKLAMVDVDENMEIALEFGVEGVPSVFAGKE